MSYDQMNYGFDGCTLQWGPMQQGVSFADMVLLANQANSAGFTYHPTVKYGQVLVGLYPAGCQSNPEMSWPLFLKSASLPQFMDPQTQTNWCWAANGESVGNFYWGAGSYSQCEIANVCQGATTCCTAPSGCNAYGYLDQALQAAKSLDNVMGATTGFATLQQRIDQNQPVGTRIAWNGGGAHFMMVTGYNNDGNKIIIQDPWFGTSTIAFASYPANYQGGGTWTHTYFTKKQTGTTP
jgi:hypothetical protein